MKPLRNIFNILATLGIIISGIRVGVRDIRYGPTMQLGDWLGIIIVLMATFILTLKFISDTIDEWDN